MCCSRVFEQTRGHFFVEERPVGGEQRRDAVALAIFDAIEDFAIHERLAQAISIMCSPVRLAP